MLVACLSMIVSDVAVFVLKRDQPFVHESAHFYPV